MTGRWSAGGLLASLLKAALAPFCGSLLAIVLAHGIGRLLRGRRQRQLQPPPPRAIAPDPAPAPVPAASRLEPRAPAGRGQQLPLDAEFEAKVQALIALVKSEGGGRLSLRGPSLAFPPPPTARFSQGSQGARQRPSCRAAEVWQRGLSLPFDCR